MAIDNGHVLNQLISEYFIRHFLGHDIELST